MRVLALLLTAGALTGLTACGDDGSSSAPATTSNLTRKNIVKACTAPTDADVVRISGIDNPRRFDFSFPEGMGIRCSTGWGTGTATAIVTVNEWDGIDATLRRLRAIQISQGNGPTRAAAALGEGAFSTARYLAFVRNGHVVTLETGLGDGGRPTLSRRQLLELARTVS